MLSRSSTPAFRPQERQQRRYAGLATLLLRELQLDYHIVSRLDSSNPTSRNEESLGGRYQRVGRIFHTCGGIIFGEENGNSLEAALNGGSVKADQKG